VNDQVFRFFGFLAATLALGLLVAVFGGKLLGAASGPQGELVTRLKALEEQGLSIALDTGQLVAPRPGYQRISIVIDEDGAGALVTSTLDFTGEFRRPGRLEAPTRVSSLGLERARYVFRDGAWAPERSDAPRLAAIVAALEERRRELSRDGADAGEYPGSTHRAWRSEAWFIRSERDAVEVTEEFRFDGITSERPISERGLRRLTLVERDGGTFSFPEEIR
jgi:hypothetical protein